MRRKFEEALPKGADIVGSKAAIGFDFCNRLFDLESEWVDLSADERQKKRLESSKPVPNEFWQWLSTLNPLQNSNLGKAVTYAVNQKEALNNFLLDGRIEISNNRAENAIHPFVNGRKNWLFSDTQRVQKPVLLSTV